MDTACKICDFRTNDPEFKIDAVALRQDLTPQAEREYFRIETKYIKETVPMKKRENLVEVDGILYHKGRLQELHDIRVEDVDVRQSFFDRPSFGSLIPAVSASSPLFYTYAIFVHKFQALHGGVETTLRMITEKMYPISNARHVIQRIRKDCVRCRVLMKKTLDLEMARHPEERTMIAPPFYNCMVDIAYTFKGRPFLRSKTNLKIHALVIVCITTSATSILAMEDLSTQQVILALERHAARYGVPKNVYIDNGTQLVALQSANFRIKDVDNFLNDKLSMRFFVPPPKAHESRGRVEARIKILREMLGRLAVTTDTRMTPLQWETVFASVASAIDDVPISRGTATQAKDAPWFVITPNRLKLGRNNNRALDGYVDGCAGMQDLLDQNQKVKDAWYAIFVSRFHYLLPEPPKWFKNSEIKPGMIVVFIVNDGQKAKNSTVWRTGRVTTVHKGNRKVDVEYPDPRSCVMSVKEKSPSYKMITVTRSVRSLSVLFHEEEIPFNTTEHFFDTTRNPNVEDPSFMPTE